MKKLGQYCSEKLHLYICQECQGEKVSQLLLHHCQRNVVAAVEFFEKFHQGETRYLQISWHTNQETRPSSFSTNRTLYSQRFGNASLRFGRASEGMASLQDTVMIKSNESWTCAMRLRLLPYLMVSAIIGQCHHHVSALLFLERYFHNITKIYFNAHDTVR